MKNSLKIEKENTAYWPNPLLCSIITLGFGFHGCAAVTLEGIHSLIDDSWDVITQISILWTSSWRRFPVAVLKPINVFLVREATAETRAEKPQVKTRRKIPRTWQLYQDWMAFSQANWQQVQPFICWTAGFFCPAAWRCWPWCLCVSDVGELQMWLCLNLTKKAFCGIFIRWICGKKSVIFGKMLGLYDIACV